MNEQERAEDSSTLDIDHLAKATDGRYHWDDPEMDDFERGWEEFGKGLQVEVSTLKGWLPGIVRETPFDNDRALS